MLKFKSIWIAIFLIIALGVRLYIKDDKIVKDKSKGYLPTEAIVIQAFPARMSRSGMKPARYGISFKAADNKTYVQYNCELSDIYKINDKVTIYYNPKNPNEPIVDKKE